MFFFSFTYLFIVITLFAFYLDDTVLRPCARSYRDFRRIRIYYIQVYRYIRICVPKNKMKRDGPPRATQSVHGGIQNSTSVAARPTRPMKRRSFAKMATAKSARPFFFSLQGPPKKVRRDGKPAAACINTAY